MTSTELIRRVWQYPALWDRNDKTYRNKSLKEMLWQKVANELGATAKVCQVKWKSLRDRYAKEVKKEQQDPSAQTDEKKWLYFDKLHFLRDTLCPRGVLPKLPTDDWHAEDSIQKSEFDITEDFIEEFPSDGQLNQYEENSVQNFMEKFEDDVKQKQRSDSPVSSLTDLPAGFSGFFEELATVIKQRKEDECDIFGKFVAAKMRRIPENRRGQVESLILKCLNDEIEANSFVECDAGKYKE